MKTMLAVLLLAALSFGAIESAQAYSCATSCYGNTCYTNCY
jgi:hypothetical protein